MHNAAKESPMPDALDLLASADELGVCVLQPGETLSAQMTIQVKPAL